ncbi:hypothetical protein GQ43DRAFT_213074 [Delitschia confertaspora ATCC 74209]|uniref:Uncharacterized protein n=1 Tax=Delitschia confertaspora ATCC 74209 TaxID=1513339 RepID=A0A9P4MNP5_9PLEO|nr:hypothetical protein GQ43DRAFT_213074 [Delitschia confertaspora ATCC 74209]
MPSSTSRAPSLTKSEKTLFSPLEKSINNTNKAGCDEPPSTRPLLRGLPAPPSPIKSENSPFNQVPKEKPSFSPLLQYENLPLSPLPQSANSPFSPLEKQTPNNSTHKIGSDVPSDYLYPKPGVIFGQPTPPKSRKNMPLNVTGSPFAKYGNENSPFSQLGKQDKSPSQTGGACKFELPYKPISD